MTSFVLVHGAFHGAWAWDRVVPLLEAAGHRVTTPDLHAAAADGADFDRQFARVLAEVPAGDVVLVGHSLGGTMVSALAEAIPERVSSLVYVAAFLPLDGESNLATNTRVLGEAADGISLSADGSSLVVDPAVAPGLYYNLCAPEVAEWATARLSPEPLGPAVHPLTLTDARYGSVPRAYIATSHDHTVPPEAQRAMLELRSCEPVVELPSDHSPFLSMPERFVEQLLALV